MARHIVQRSILDYKPATVYEDNAPQTDITPEEKPEKKPSRKKNLYSTAQPPSEF